VLWNIRPYASLAGIFGWNQTGALTPPGLFIANTVTGEASSHSLTSG
jgi:hypothetical protein